MFLGYTKRICPSIYPDRKPERPEVEIWDEQKSKV
ncbi:hypothetical protein X792_00130 [Dehalococcoides mccartyi CG1]|nr:hypothetical protein X792_00130 [Dehalococcoides mccartyi CG1]